MSMILVGASPLGSRALVALNVPYLLIFDPATEAVEDVVGTPDQVIACDYHANPLNILDLPLPHGVQGVVSFTELGLLPAALLGEALDIATISVAAVLKTRNKWLMRRTLAVLPGQPACGLLTETAQHTIPFPAIVKPIAGTASEHIHYVASADDPWLAQLLKHPEGYMWEQFIPGTEYSVETVTFNGQHMVLGITEKRTTGAPHFIELEHHAPAHLAPDDENIILSAVRTGLDCLGVTKGAAHTEVKFTGTEAMIIETHTRPGGDRIPRLTELVSGDNQHQLCIQSLLGLERPALQPAQAQAAGIRFLQLPSGTIEHNPDLAAARSLPGLDELELHIPQDRQIQAWTSNRDRPGYAVVTGASRDEVDQRLDAIQRAVVAAVQAIP